MPKSDRVGGLPLLIQAALFAALIVLVTVTVRFPAGTNGGYWHLGDTMVYVAACCLPTPYAMAAAAIGGGLSDVLAGAPLWAVASVPLKALLCLCFTDKSPRLLTGRNLLGTLFGGLITCGGYYGAEWLLFGSPAAALIALYENIGQAVLSAGLFCILAAALDKMKWKERMGGFR